VGSRAGLGDVEKRKFLTLPELELRPLSLPARSQSLYRLHYPSSGETFESGEGKEGKGTAMQGHSMKLGYRSQLHNTNTLEHIYMEVTD
jgi:hypothetical protein